MGENSKKIRLGICMAGAVSAGAYTAGVVDYLIETLERWAEAKKRIEEKKKLNQPLTPEEELVPLHDVVIEVLSGSSAGGMTAAVLSYSFNDGTYLTQRNGELISENYDRPEKADEPTKLYDSWINMVDEEQASTFSKLMHPEDVVSFGKMKSLLNSKPIDEIAERAIPDKIDFNPPKYISENLSIVLSVTNLEGIPVDIDFTNMADSNPTRNVLTTHSGFLHYKFQEEANIDFDYPPLLITDESKERLALAAMATGAFPFGLSNRKIEIEREHFEKFRARMKAKNMNVNLSLPDDHNYTFTAVDGGAINNEPISTTFRLLEKKKNSRHKEDKHYVILIDPFPTVTTATQVEEYEHPGDEGYSLKDQFFKLITAFRNESTFKQEDLHETVAGNERYLISPSKKGYYFLACGLIEGFGGFMKKAFRKHDYQLGRKNCQAFLRYHFGEEPEKFAKMTGIELTQAQQEQWRYDANFLARDKEGYQRHNKIPLIPDMILLQKTESDDFEVLNEETLAELEKVRTE
ncbi:MAG: patatin-like phospholipase family protein, partial [Bacteroidota bacterium]